LSDSSAPREYFIPLRKGDLLALLLADPALTADERALGRQVAAMVTARLHYDFHRTLEELKEAYAPFDPDADTHSLNVLPAEERSRRAAVVFDKLGWLLARANFQSLTRPDLEAAMRAASAWGINLRVDFDIFDRLEVFARGAGTDYRTRRPWRKLKRRVRIAIPVFRRLVVMFRLKEPCDDADRDHPDPIYLKVFRNIPRDDIDMLLPATKLRMSLVDRSKIFVPTLSGGVLALVKLVQAILAVATISTLAFVSILGGSAAFGLRSFHGWLRHKQRYQLHLTRSLYYRNLDNNAGVLFRLLDEAEEQEFREAILAWFFLWRRAGSEGWDCETLDAVIETFLTQHLGAHVDFEIGDALEKLARMSMIEAVEGGRWRACAPREALARLDNAWDELFRY
jgi:hypothetical protein